jgi:hypothetical protein
MKKDHLSSFQDTEKAYGGRKTYEEAKAAGRTKLNYHQWVQVRTPEFKRFFGGGEVDVQIDPASVSKLIDPDTGEPRVWYHGTVGRTLRDDNAEIIGKRTNDFSHFDPKFSNSSSMTGVPESVFAFSSSPSAASTYAGQYDVNGWDTPESEAEGTRLWDAGDLRRASDYQMQHYGIVDITFDDGGNIMPVYLSAQNPLIVDAKGASWKNIPWKNVTTNTNVLAGYARAKGHDALIVRNVRDQATGTEKATPADTIFVFKPTQIKSAIANNGEFSLSNENICDRTSVLIANGREPGEQRKAQAKAQSRTLTREEYEIALDLFLEQKKNKPEMNLQKLAAIRTGIKKAIDEKVGKNPTKGNSTPRKPTSKDKQDLER